MFFIEMYSIKFWIFINLFNYSSCFIFYFFWFIIWYFNKLKYSIYECYESDEIINIGKIVYNSIDNEFEYITKEKLNLKYEIKENNIENE